MEKEPKVRRLAGLRIAVEQSLTLLAFHIQGLDGDKDLIPLMPEPTQEVNWEPKELAKLAMRKHNK